MCVCVFLYELFPHGWDSILTVLWHHGLGFGSDFPYLYTIQSEYLQFNEIISITWYFLIFKEKTLITNYLQHTVGCQEKSQRFAVPFLDLYSIVLIITSYYFSDVFGRVFC